MKKIKERKSSGIAAVLSFLIPGLGQIYNGRIGKGLLLIIGLPILLVIGIFTIFIVIGVVFIILYIALWIWQIYDAYKTAESTWK